MSGINVAQLREAYKAVGGYTMTEEALINKALEDGRISKSEANALKNGLNGSANWGKIGDTIERQAFDPSKADVYKAEHLIAESRRPKKAKKANEAVKEEKSFAQIDREIQQKGAAAVVSLLTFGWAQSCSDDFKAEQNANIKIDVNLDTFADLVAQLLEEQKKGNARNEENWNTLIGLINKMYDQDVQNAQNVEAFLQKILDMIDGNTEILSAILDQVTKGNSTLAELKVYMEENNADQKKILEVITEIKFGIDKLHDDNTGLKASFESYLNVVVQQLKNGNAKLDDLIALVKLVNENVVKGNKQQQEAAAKVLAAIQAMNCNMTAGMNAILKAINDGNAKVIASIDKLTAVAQNIYNKFKDHDEKTTKLLNNIMVAINGLTAKLDKIDLSKIESQLNTIIKNGNLTNTELANITKLLETLNKKVDTMDKNEAARNEKILQAIADLKGGMVTEFEKLVSIGNQNNKLTTETNKLINTVIDMLKKQPVLEVDLSSVIKAIKETGSKLNSSLINIANLLTTVNDKLDGLDKDCVTYFKAIIDAIGKKTDKGVDLSAIEKKLDAILQAIKDHKIVIEGGCGRCNDDSFCNDPVNEGIIEDLNWLLG